MESPLKVEMIKQAIKQVMEEVGGDTKSSTSSSDDDDDNHRHRLLSKLMSQLEKLEDESEANSQPTKENNTVSKSDEDEEQKIVKELKEVKKQNLITHCLLSVMILLTVVWQVSEVSIILKLKDGVSHPFRSIGNMFMGMIKPRKSNGNDEVIDSSSITSNLIEASPVHDLKIPELPHVELPKLDFSFIDEN
ncbi:uncharacterized protein [Rutidosis leptorrhynchoides]|uniref:uncharacterized protein n=1 Tax=Rutidosis leptorrhynchoides TaxID=125765 RepID=UPI003A9A1A4A